MTKPGSDISDRLWGGKVQDGSDEPVAWLHVGVSDLESCKFNLVSSKYKFFRVENDAVPTTEVEVFDCLIVALLSVSRPEEGVIDAPNYVSEVGSDGIEAFRVSVSGCVVTLRGDFIPVSTPQGDKCCEMLALLCDWDTMVTIPCITSSFLDIVWYRSGKMEWGLSMVGLAMSMLV